MQGSISPSSLYEQLPNHQSQVFSIIYPVGEFSFKEMRTWSKSKISSYCFCLVWIKRFRSLRECKITNTNGGTLLHRPFSSYRKLLDWVGFRILSNINNGAPLRKYVEHLWMIGLMVGMYVNGLLHVWWVGFSSLESWSYSKE